MCLIVLDTVRADHLFPYGFPRRTTLNLDRLASCGLMFTNTPSTANWAAPGHLSMFTGTYPSENRNHGDPHMPERLLSMAEILNQHGYYSIALYNNAPAAKLTNVTQGFNLDSGVYRNSWVCLAWQRLWYKLFRAECGAPPTLLVALRTIRWMASREQPLFLYLNLLEPHAEYLRHEPFSPELLGGDNLTRIPNLFQVRRLCDNREIIDNDPRRFAAYNKASFDYLNAAYDSELAYLDRQLERFVSGLRDSGLLDEVLLLAISAHGEFLGERSTRGHPRILLDDVLQVPLALTHPGSIRPQVSEGRASLVNFLPALPGLFGYKHPRKLDLEGMNLLADFIPSDRTLLGETVWWEGGTFALIEGSLKLPINDDPRFGNAPFERTIVDREDDLGETTHLDAEYPERLKRMSRDLEAWTERIRAAPSQTIEIDEEATRSLPALGHAQLRRLGA